MIKILFWILILLGCLTTVMLYFIMVFRRAFAFKEALIYNFAFLGLFSVQMMIDLSLLGYIDSFFSIDYLEQVFLILSSLYLPLFSNTLVENSKLKIPSIFFKICAKTCLIFVILSLFIQNKFLLQSGTYFFIFGAHYSTILLTFSKISETSVGYGSVIKPKQIKGYCATFLMFSPFITFGDLLRFEFLGIPKGIYFLPSLFFMKNTFSFSGIVKFLTVISRDQLEIISKSTILKEVVFSSSEKEIIKYMFEGKSSTEIAQILFKSPNTIKDNIKKIYKKTDTHNKTELLFFIKRFKNSPL